MEWKNLEKHGPPKEECNCLVMFHLHGEMVNAFCTKRDGELVFQYYNPHVAIPYMHLKPRYYLVLEPPKNEDKT